VVEVTATAQQPDVYALASRGWHLHPLDHPALPRCAGARTAVHDPDSCTERGKHPCTRWSTAATSDPRQLAAWFSGATRNVGIACGPSRLLVVDEDAPGELARYAATVGAAVPPTFTVATGKGRHYYFTAPEQRITTTEGALRDYAVNIRGQGGYVAGPGSVHATGAVYTVEHDHRVADCPGWLVAAILEQPGAGRAAADEFLGTDRGWWREGAIEHPHRHAAMVAAAGWCRRVGLHRDEAIPVMRDVLARCVPGGNGKSYTLPEALGRLDDIYRRYEAGDRRADSDTEPIEPGGVLVRLADVAPEQLGWLWEGRLPAGKVVTLDGDPGTGKSTVSVDWAAHLTTGNPWPDGAACPLGDVVVLSAEDGLADTIRPRLDAAGGDPGRVHCLTEVRTVTEDGQITTRPPTLADLAAIADAIRSTGARLLVVDVLMAYLPGKVDSHRDQDVRAVLHRLAELATDTGCTVLLLRHLNKTGVGSPMYRGGGSIGIIGAARAGYVVAADPDDETQRVLAPVKFNLATEPASLSYRLEPAPGSHVARVVWGATTEHRAADLLRAPDPDSDRTEREGATEWLREFLTAEGRCKSGDAKKAARAAGFSDRTLARARQALRVVIADEGYPRVTYWSLPDSGATDPQHSQCGTTGTTGTTVADLHKHSNSCASQDGCASRASGDATGTTDAARGARPPGDEHQEEHPGQADPPAGNPGDRAGGGTEGQGQDRPAAPVPTPPNGTPRCVDCPPGSVPGSVLAGQDGALRCRKHHFARREAS
jgi:hypothetical protein